MIENMRVKWDAHLRKLHGVAGVVSGVAPLLARFNVVPEEAARTHMI